MKFLALLCSFALVSSALAEKTKVTFSKKHQTFLDKYCMDCHDADTEKGDVNLEDLSFEITD